MFQFPGLPPARLCVQRAAAGYGPRRVRPFGDPRVKRICAPNRGLSQLVTSFVGFLCQGIHRVPLPSSSRWLGTYIHPGGLSVAGAIRCDLLEKEKISSLSRYAALKVRRGRALETGHCALSRDERHQRERTGTVSSVMIVSVGDSCLPRKEVIQPHLPVRLPCYDFTPLTLHTFGASLPCGLGRRLRVQTTRVV